MAEDGGVGRRDHAVRQAEAARGQAACPRAPDATQIGAVGNGVGQRHGAGDPGRAVNERAVVRVGGAVVQGVAAEAVEPVVGDQVGLVAVHGLVHGIANVRLGAGGGPDAHFVHLAVEIAAVEIATHAKRITVGRHGVRRAAECLRHAIQVEGARAAALHRGHVIPAIGLEVEAAGGLLVEVQIRTGEAKQVAVGAGRLVLADQAAQAAEAVGLEPGLEGITAGEIEAAVVRNVDVVVGAVEVEGVARGRHRGGEHAMFPVRRAVVIRRIGTDVVGLATRGQPRQAAGEGAQAAAVAGDSIVAGHGRVARGVPHAAARDDGGTALSRHRAAAFCCGGGSVAHPSRGDIRCIRRLETRLGGPRPTGQRGVHRLNTPIVGLPSRQALEFPGEAGTRRAKAGHAPPAVGQVGHGRHHLAAAGRRADAHVVGEAVGWSLAIRGCVPRQGGCRGLGIRRQRGRCAGNRVGIRPTADIDARQAVARDQDIEVAVVVVVAPRGLAIRDIRQAARLGGEGVAALILIKRRERCPARAAAGEQHVQVTVVVPVAPRDAGVVAARELAAADIGEGAAAVVAIDAGDRLGGATAGRTRVQDVEVTVAVVVAPRHTARVHAGETGDLGEGAGAVVAINAGHARVGGAVGTGDQQVEVTVVVVIAPRRAAEAQVGHCGGDLGERSVAVVTIERGILPAAADPAGQQQIEVTVIVVVAPYCCALVGCSQTDAAVHEDAAVVAVNAARTVVAGVDPDDHQIEVAIVVVVAPGDGALGNAGEARGDVDQHPAVVAVDLGVGGRGGRAGPADENEVQVAVVVIVPPGRIAVGKPGQAGGDVDEPVRREAAVFAVARAKRSRGVSPYVIRGVGREAG